MILFENGKYRVKTSDNGYSLTVIRKSDNTDFFLQGDGAAQFRDEMERFEDTDNEEFQNYFIDQYEEFFKPQEN